MPMARYESKRAGGEGEVFAHLPFDHEKAGDRLAADGVSCSLCHQITQEEVGTRESFVGGFVIDPPTPTGERHVYGPFKIEDGQTRSCGRRRLSADRGEAHPAIGVVRDLPYAVSRRRWGRGQVDRRAARADAVSGVAAQRLQGKRSCQSCHMPVVQEDGADHEGAGRAAGGVSRHVFVGSNFFMQRC